MSLRCYLIAVPGCSGAAPDGSAVCGLLDLRCGFAYDNGPVPRNTSDYLLPVNDWYQFTLGTSLHWRAWTLDLSYAYLVSRNRSVAARPADGVLKGRFYDGQTDLYGIGLGYKF